MAGEGFFATEAKETNLNKEQPLGYPGLDENGKIPLDVFPDEFTVSLINALKFQFETV